MTIIFSIAAYAILLFSPVMRSNLTLYFAAFMFLTLGISKTKYKRATVVLMTLQAAISAGLIFLNINGNTQSNYLLFIAAISILMIVSITVEMIIAPKKTASI